MTARMTATWRLASLTHDELALVLKSGPVVVLLPVGSVEPHGPHLALDTDLLLSEVSAARAATALNARGVTTLVAPALAYGVTDFAAGFAGAIGLSAATVTAVVRELLTRLLAEGFAHVCVVNHHLEPAQDQALRGALREVPRGRASLACPLTRRWGRTLSEEFKRGECHAGRYETSLALAAGAAVRPSYASLPAVSVSLSRGIQAGLRTFAEMGMTAAYAGAPAEGTAAEGDALYARLTEMIVTEVEEALKGREP